MLNNTGSDDCLIAESQNYYIKGSYESADLYSRITGERITCVGHHYGDPVDGLIDRNEKFCVTVGCGFILYYLNEPFEEYTYDCDTAQWIESGRESDNINWIKEVRQISDTEIELTDEDNNKEVITVSV